MTSKMHLGLAAIGLMASRIADPRAVEILPDEYARWIDDIDRHGGATYEDAPRQRRTAARKDQQPGWNKPNILKKYRRKARR